MYTAVCQIVSAPVGVIANWADVQKLVKFVVIQLQAFLSVGATSVGGNLPHQ